jgi:peptide/nickel transport system permease protein
LNRQNIQLPIIYETVNLSAGSNRLFLIFGFALGFFWLITYPVVYFTEFAGEISPHHYYEYDLNRLREPETRIAALLPELRSASLEELNYLPPQIPLFRSITDYRFKRLRRIILVHRETVPEQAETLIKSALVYPESTKQSDSPPQRVFPLGSSRYRNNLLNLIYKGAMGSYLPGFIATLVSIILGTILGVSASFPETNSVKSLASFITKTLLSLPRILFLVVIAALAAYNPYVIMAALGILNSPRLARLMADQIEILKQQQFIESARELGLSDKVLIFKHILYHHCIYLFIIQSAFCMADSIFTGIMLSYLKFEPDGVSWGKLVLDGFEMFSQGCHWMWFFPVAAIIMSIGGLYLLGNSALNLHHLRRQN